MKFLSLPYRIGVAIFLITVLVIYWVTDDRYFDEYYSRYQDLTIKDHFNGKIESIENAHGTALIVTQKKDSVLIPISYNYLNDRRMTQVVDLNSNDLIIKKSGSETLFVRRGNQEFFFILGKVVEADGTVRDF